MNNVVVMYEWEAEEQFMELLDDTYEPVSVCGYQYDAARLFKQIDPIAFRQELLNYIDSQDIEIVED